MSMWGFSVQCLFVFPCAPSLHLWFYVCVVKYTAESSLICMELFPDV